MSNLMSHKIINLKDVLSLVQKNIVVPLTFQGYQPEKLIKRIINFSCWMGSTYSKRPYLRVLIVTMQLRPFSLGCFQGTL